MKKTLWFIILVFSSIFLKAQTDIIYPADGSAIIFDCKINEVKNGNMVYYTKNQVSDTISAIAITKDGVYINLSHYANSLKQVKPVAPVIEHSELYNGFDFGYYQQCYSKSKRNARRGVLFTVIGCFGIVGGIALASDKTTVDDGAAIALMSAGVIFFNIGIPVLISGKIKATNNKRAMEITKPLTLSFGSTRDGVGFRLVLN